MQHFDIETFGLPLAAREAALGAMKSVARANGRFDDAERELLSACARCLDVDVSPDALGSADPAAVASAITDATTRERVVQALMITAMIDGEVSDREVNEVARFAAALDVREGRITDLRLLVDGHVALMWLHIARRSFARDTFREALQEEGLRGVWKIVGPLLGAAPDWELARRYNALGELPEDTLGYAYWRFIVEHNFGLPGEPGGVAERGIWHDMVHVMAGYPPTPDGEVQNVSFIAGFRRDDPFFWLFTIALQFQLGVKVSPYSQGAKGHFEPSRVIRALQRGAAVRCDLSREWDFERDLARPLEQVRRDLGVIPL